MKFDIYSDLSSLYRSRGLAVSERYLDCCRSALGEGLAYATPAMCGITETLLSSPRLFAHNLSQNATDEAKGAARVRLVAERYASGELLRKMRRHVADEFKHSVLFRKLIPLTGVGHLRREADELSEEVGKVLAFDDDLKAFLCRVHSIEIRSWTVLRIYIDVLARSAGAAADKAIPVLEDILADEVNHVFYTGEQISAWIEGEPAVAETLTECFAHTNRETWRDLANMADYLADHHSDIWAARPIPEAAQRQAA